MVAKIIEFNLRARICKDGAINIFNIFSNSNMQLGQNTNADIEAGLEVTCR